MTEGTWFVYLVRCVDGTLYCGITKDVNYRVQTHNSGRGAKYTRSRLPVVLVWTSLPVAGKGDALRYEARVKKLTRSQKEELVRS